MAFSRWKSLPFEVWVAFIAIQSSVQFWANPHEQVVSGVHPWDYVWASMYGLSGLLILWGLLRPRSPWEALGLGFFSTGVAVNSVVVGLFVGFPLATQLTFFTVFVAAVVRLRTLVQGRDVIEVAPEAPSES